LKEHVMKKIAALVAAIACGGKFQAPPPVSSVTLPTGAALKPYDAQKPGLPRPEGMALVNGNAYVALANYDANFVVRGPGLLAKVVPSTGLPTLIDLAGASEQDCKNPGVVRADGTLVYVTCGGDFKDGSGQALVEVDTTTNAVTRRVALPVPPTGVTVGPSRIWIGDALNGDLYAVDKTTFALVAGPVTAPCPPVPTAANPDPSYYQTINEVLAIGDNLYVLCSNSKDGIISQLDATAGVVGLQAPIGPIAVEMAATADGRIAVISGADNGLRLVTITPSALSVQTFFPFASGTISTLQDIRSRDNFLYTAASGSNTVQKLDLNANGGPKVIDEFNVGTGSAPWNVLPLDDDQALVSNQTANTLTGVKWAH
jgi:DNA-binding beta-propeller fold protein YncE